MKQGSIFLHFTDQKTEAVEMLSHVSQQVGEQILQAQYSFHYPIVNALASLIFFFFSIMASTLLKLLEAM